MKKIGKILAGTMLGIAFAGAIGVYCWQYDVGGIQKLFKEQETESETIKQIKLKVPERKIYELGEEIECDGLTWKINSAEFVEDYDSLDAYYHARTQGLGDPSEWAKIHYQRYFSEEVQFFMIKATLTNTSKVHKEYSCSNMKFYNFYGEEEFKEIWLGSLGSDVKCVSETGEILPIERSYSPISIESGETLEIEYVMEFNEYSGYGEESQYLYDLYLSTLSLTPVSGFGNNGIDNKVHLNIAPKHMTSTQTEPENSYEEQRNIPEMKCRQWTNLEMKNYQTEGYPTLYQKEDVIKEFKEEVIEENYLFDRRWINTQIAHVQTVDWETLPEDFADRGALQKMAECYETSYGYSKDQMKILLLDINFIKTASEEAAESELINRNDEVSSLEKIDFYSYTYLYTRDENEKRWVFGTADDWLVTENSATSGRTGHINTEQFANEQTVTLQAAYLLPPEIYDEGALYFNGGEHLDIDFLEQPIQRIYLK